MPVAESYVMKRVLEQNILLKKSALNCKRILQSLQPLMTLRRRTDGQTDRWSGGSFPIKDYFTLLPKPHLKRRFKSRNFQIIPIHNKGYVQPQMQWSVQSPQWRFFYSCVSPSLALPSPAISLPYILLSISLCPCNSFNMTLYCVWFEIKLSGSLGNPRIFNNADKQIRRSLQVFLSRYKNFYTSLWGQKAEV
jgi:hypothetical protein